MGEGIPVEKGEKEGYPFKSPYFTAIYLALKRSQLAWYVMSMGWQAQGGKCPAPFVLMGLSPHDALFCSRQVTIIVHSALMRRWWIRVIQLRLYAMHCSTDYSNRHNLQYKSVGRWNWCLRADASVSIGICDRRHVIDWDRL